MLIVFWGKKARKWIEEIQIYLKYKVECIVPIRNISLCLPVSLLHSWTRCFPASLAALDIIVPPLRCSSNITKTQLHTQMHVHTHIRVFSGCFSSSWLARSSLSLWWWLRAGPARRSQPSWSSSPPLQRCGTPTASARTQRRDCSSAQQGHVESSKDRPWFWLMTQSPLSTHL